MSSLHAYLWAMDQEPDTTAEKMVLLALAHCCNDGHGEDANLCFPGQETLAKFARCSVETVRRALRKLAEDGYVKVEPATDATNGQRLFNRYRLQFEVATKAPDGSTKTHRANCPVDTTPKDEKSTRHAQDANLDEGGENPPGNLPDGHRSTHRSTHRSICGPNLKDEYLYSTTRAGACEAGASPARAEGPRTSIVLRRGDKGWTTWLEHLPAHLAEQAEEAGAIEVPFRFPGRDSQLISLVRTNGVFEQPVGTAAAKPPAGGRVQPSLSVCRGDASWADWMAEIGPEKAAKAEIAGEIAVTARWPKRDGARFIGVVAPGGGA